MKKFIEEFNELELTQNGDYEDNDFGEKMNKIIKDCEIVKKYIDIESHRHYETSLFVYKTKENELFGIRLVSKFYDDMSSFEDIYFKLKAYQVEEFTTVSYRRIKN